MGSSGGSFSGVGKFVELDVFSYSDITFNAEVSDSLGVDSLFSIGFVTCAALSLAFS